MSAVSFEALSDDESDEITLTVFAPSAKVRRAAQRSSLWYQGTWNAKTLKAAAQVPKSKERASRSKKEAFEETVDAATPYDAARFGAVWLLLLCGRGF
jgi:hypothetical protein